MTFSLAEALLWIVDLYFGQKQQFEVKNILMMIDLFLTNKQFFTLHDVNWWTWVVWITFGLFWCFYQLFGFSFWRHPFNAEDPLVSKGCNAKFLQICFHEGTNSSISWMVNFSNFSFLGKLFLQVSEYFLGPLHCCFLTLISKRPYKDGYNAFLDEMRVLWI